MEIRLPEKEVLVNYHPNGRGKTVSVVSNSLLEARFNDLPDESFGAPGRQQREK
jgi:hypothetical protein